LSEFLNSSLALKQFERSLKGVGVPDLHLENIAHTLIPLPPLSVQTEIAGHITNIRNKAKQLEHEAKEIVEQAKQKVENMILGE